MALTDERAGLIALAERCEAAEGPDRKLDEAIERATGNYTAFAHYTLGDDDFDEYVPTRYSASIDAAMSLVPEGWNRSFTDDPDDLGCVIGELWTRKRNAVGHAATPALALTAACLRARATENTDAPFA